MAKGHVEWRRLEERNEKRGMELFWSPRGRIPIKHFAFSMTEGDGLIVAEADGVEER